MTSCKRSSTTDEQKSLTHDTTDEELQRIATRAEEVAATAAAGAFGFTVEPAHEGYVL